MREVQEQIRTKFYLMINSIAYRIHVTHDAAGIEKLDPDIQQIMKSYIRNWPYQNLNLDMKAKVSKKQSARDFGAEFFLQNLAAFEKTD